MALVSIGEARWRMLRRVLRKKKFTYADIRNMTRHDEKHFGWLVGNGFVTRLAEDAYELTERARAAADLGEYHWEPATGPTTPPKPEMTAGKPPKKR